MHREHGATADETSCCVGTRIKQIDELKRAIGDALARP